MRYGQYSFFFKLSWHLCGNLQCSGATDPGEFTEVIYCARLRDSALRRKASTTKIKIYYC